VRYWDAGETRAARCERSEAALIDEAGHKLEEAIRLRLRADVELGCYLSGGVDSSSVLGIASRRLGKKLKAFTICFEHPDFDEHGVAGEQAAYAGSDYHPIRVTNAEFAQVFEDSVAACEGFQINGHAPARYILSREVRRAGVKAVLGGEGADELFLGYHFAQAALARSTRGVSAGQVARGAAGALGRLWSGPSEAVQQVGEVSRAAAWLVRLLGFPPELMESLVARYRGLRGLIRPEFLAGFAGEDLGQDFLGQLDWKEQLWGREPARHLHRRDCVLVHTDTRGLHRQGPLLFFLLLLVSSCFLQLPPCFFILKPF
jgi:asparagine synthase (glutamine-hydrolysing)